MIHSFLNIRVVAMSIGLVIFVEVVRIIFRHIAMSRPLAWPGAVDNADTPLSAYGFWESHAAYPEQRQYCPVLSLFSLTSNV